MTCEHTILELYKKGDDLFQCRFCGIIFGLRDYKFMKQTQIDTSKEINTGE